MALTKVKGHIIADDLALGGNPTTSTQSTGNNTTRIATTAFVQTELTALVDSSPSALNTLNELAAALGDDANFSTTVTNSIATKLPLAGGTMTGNIAHAGDFTIDVGGDITLDADGGDIKFLDDGTVIGKLSNQGSGNFNIISSVQDKDLVFKGNDGGSTITALTLDMSAAGKATFNSHVALADSKQLQLGADADMIIYHDGTTNYVQAAKQDSDLILRGNDGGSGINALTLDMSDAGKAIFNAGATFSGAVQLNDAQLNVHSSSASAIIGSIGNTANDLNIFSTSSGHNGLRFHVNGILPTDNSGTIVDNDADLGDPSYRFKNLYLSAMAKAETVDIETSIGPSLNFSSTYNYSPNRDWRFIVNNFGASNWGGFSLEKSTGQQGTPSVAVFGIDGAGNMGVGIGGAAGASSQPAAKLDVGGTIRTNTGILFGTDTAAANRLDDYEEGTWTPDLRNHTTSFSTQSWAYGPQATYTKIGRMVFIHLSGRLSSVAGNGSGEFRIFGLPFTAHGTGGYQEYRMNFFLGNQVTASDSYSAFAFVRNGGTDFGTRLLAGGDNVFTANRIDSDTFFSIFGCYNTA